MIFFFAVFARFTFKAHNRNKQSRKLWKNTSTYQPNMIWGRQKFFIFRIRSEQNKFGRESSETTTKASKNNKALNKQPKHMSSIESREEDESREGITNDRPNELPLSMYVYELSKDRLH